MAKIKRAGFGERLIQTGNVPSQVSPDAFTEAAQAQDEFGRKIVQVNEELRSIRATRQTNQAVGESKFALSAIKQAAINDPNPDNRELYFKQLQELGRTAGQNIERGPELAQFQSQLNGDVRLAGLAVAQTFIKKNLDAAKGAMEFAVSGFELDYLDSIGNPRLQKQALDGALDVIQGLMDRGAIDLGAGLKRMESIKEDFPIKAAESVIGINPLLALEMLRGQQFGIKEDKDRELLVAKAIAKIKRVEEERKLEEEATQRVNEDELAPKVIAGDVPETELREKALLGEISDDFADDSIALLDSALSVNVPDSISLPNFNRFSEMIATNQILIPAVEAAPATDTTPAVEAAPATVQPITDSEIRNLIMAANTEGVLSKPHAQTLVGKAIAGEQSERKTRLALEIQGMKAWGQTTILGEFTEESITGTARGTFERLLFLAQDQVERERATGDRITNYPRSASLISQWYRNLWIAGLDKIAI